MDNLLFSAQRAEALNQELQQLDPRLILFCHYAPYGPTGNAYTDVILGILNLFRATADSVPIWKAITKRNQNVDLPQHLDIALIKSFRRLNKFQDHLRGFVAHNNHPSNGFQQEKHIEVFNNWEKSSTDYYMLSSPEGPQLALENILSLGEDLESAYRQLIQRLLAVEGQQREDLITGIVNQSLYWYLDTSHKSLFFDQVNSLLVSDYECSKENTYELSVNRDILLNKYLLDAGKTEEALSRDFNRLLVEQVKNDVWELWVNVPNLLPENLFGAVANRYMKGYNLSI